MLTSCYSGESASISFQPYDNLREQWRCLNRYSPHATLYHSEEWIEILRLAYRFSFWAAVLKREGMVRAGAVFARARRPFSCWWVSLPFSDACPPLATDADAETILLEELSGLYSTERFEIRGTAAPSQWQSAECFLSWELNLSEPLPKIHSGLETNFRRNLTKAVKAGIGITHGNSPEMVERFYRLHVRSRQRLGLPCQPLRFFRFVRQVLEDNVDVWLASRDGRDVGAIFLIGYRDTLFFKWSTRDPSEASGAVHLLAWSLVEHWAGRFRRLDLGRTDSRNAGLNRFKYGMGGRSTSMPYVFFPVAPRNLSSEVLSARQRFLASIWRRLPQSVCRGVEALLYQHLS